MRERWQPVALLALGLFVVNALARLVVWRAAPSDAAQIRIGLAAIGLTAVVAGIAGYRWAVRHPMGRAVLDLAVGILVGCLLAILVGPFAGGSVPFREGAGFVVSEIWHYLLAGGLGGAVGLLVAVAMGRDRRSQALKRYAQAQASRPRRSVRR
jgi:hypothetical protein